MVLEVLLREVRKDKEIKGMKMRGFNYKYGAFGGDIILLQNFTIAMKEGVWRPCRLLH